MMDEPPILQKEIESSITLITLNRPEKRNALNISLLEALGNSLEKLQVDLSQRIVIVNGTDPIFCAGLDLAEARQLDKEKESAEWLAKVLTKIYQLPQITIACVQGAALAGGAGLACACDYALAATGSHLGFPEVRRGLVPAQISVLLRRQLKERHLKELLLWGESVEAEKALEMGLINQIVPQENLLSKALEVAKSGLKGAPGAIRKTKELLDILSPRGFGEDLELALEFHHESRHSAEASEGMAAFLEKRDPSWNI